MKKINIFDKKYFFLFCPYDGVEFMHNVLVSLGYIIKDWRSKQGRQEALYAIEELFKLDLIYVFHWGAKHDQMKDKSYTIEQTLEHIKSVWFEGANTPDFYGMVMLGSKKWYVDKLQESGYVLNSNWEKFYKSKLRNMEQWIEENRPRAVGLNN